MKETGFSDGAGSSNGNSKKPQSKLPGGSGASYSSSSPLYHQNSSGKNSLVGPEDQA